MNSINQLSETVIRLCIKIHKTIGAGLFESVYETILCYELSKNAIPFICQHPVPVCYDDIKMDAGFRADIIVDNKLLIEIKSIEAIAPVRKKQVLTYLTLTNLEVGLLINFNVELLKDGITRLYNKNYKK
ncbi:MAG TPA: GxxExxY protein [Parafilimonas sp.]|nr:GxxExxY protein [Parafilimonas sp.]